MPSIDVKELNLQNRDLRVLRLRELRESVENHRYDISAAEIAEGIMREAMSAAAVSRLTERR